MVVVFVVVVMVMVDPYEDRWLSKVYINLLDHHVKVSFRNLARSLASEGGTQAGGAGNSVIFKSREKEKKKEEYRGEGGLFTKSTRQAKGRI